MLQLLQLDDARRLRDFFTDAGYTHGQFQENPKLRELPTRGSFERAFSENDEHPSIFDTLLRWFCLGNRQTRDAVRPFVPDPILEIMVDCGLLTSDGDSLAGAVMLTPCDEFLFAADLASRMSSAQSSDIVLWPNPTTR
ncbi:MAG TPA: hypothetical protein VNV86_03045, partial [Candidatus Acidoferrum sp.]|nr:hypothetical protein [Candidatus Acidoferrum sp.]